MMIIALMMSLISGIFWNSLIWFQDTAKREKKSIDLLYFSYRLDNQIAAKEPMLMNCNYDLGTTSTSN